MREKKSSQDILRQDLLNQVEHYLGYADDVHNDSIYVDENTYEVGFCTRNDPTRIKGCEYYNVLDLIKSDGTWFKPDKKAIEAIVHLHLPATEVKSFIDNAVDCIRNFLIEKSPSDPSTCFMSIGDITMKMSCFDESEYEESEEEPQYEDPNDDEDCESYSFESFRGIVRKISTGYTISQFKLAKLAVQYVGLNT